MKSTSALTSFLCLVSSVHAAPGILALLPPLTPSDSTPPLQTSLFPAQYTYQSGFTTASGVSVDGVSKTALSDSSLGLTRIMSGVTHDVVQQNNKTAWRAFYPAGSYNPSGSPKGGFGFYVAGTPTFAKALKSANEVILSYSVMFQKGFQWNMGGKLPGGFGGIGESAFGCSGGRQEDRAACFDLRAMWRTGGQGELYAYAPMTKANQDAFSAVPPRSVQNPEYGVSVGRGAFTFPSGKWVTIAERIKLNDPKLNNAEVEIWFNGKSVISVKNLSLRDDSSSIVQGMHFQTFFGGSTSDWASPTDQTAWFADVSGAVIA